VIVLPPPRSHEADAAGLGLSWHAARIVRLNKKQERRAIRFFMFSPEELL
jgi:hypothetical protein